MDYYDFVLRLGPSGESGKYNVRAESIFAGVTTGKFHSPFTDLELENFILKVGRTRRGVRKINSPQWDAAKSFGEKLYATLFAEDIRAHYISSRNAALHEGKGLRVKFIVDAPDLTNYPWEFLYDRSSGRFLCLYEATPIIRYVELPSPLQLLRVTPPLRILAIASSPSNYEPLNINQEKKNLDSALGDLVAQKQVAVDWLPAANLGTLRTQLLKQKYHMVHFIGHGGFDHATQDGQLIFEDESGNGNAVSGERLAVLLANHPSLRLAVLNACEGARASTQDPFAGVATTFVKNGDLAAVVAMQFEVTDDASVRFSNGFYSALAVGAAVDAAVTQGRLAIFDQHNDVEWGTPVLYLRAPDGVIFSPLSKEEVETIARERAEQERREQVRLEQERLERERVDAERAAREKAELERLALVELERQQLVQEQEQAERKAKEQAEQEIKEQERAEQERLAREKAEAERLASQKAEADRLAREQAEADRAAKIAGLYRAAQQSFSRKKYDEAIRSLEALLALDTANGPARELLLKVQSAQQEQQRQEYQNASKEAGRSLEHRHTLRDELVQRAEWVRTSPLRILGLGAVLLLACLVCTTLTNSVFPLFFGTTSTPTPSAVLSQPTAETKPSVLPPTFPTLIVPGKGEPTSTPALTQNVRTPTSVPTQNASTPTPVPTQNAATRIFGPTLTNPTTKPISPSPTPNGGGKQIAYVYEGDGNQEIYLMDSDGTNARNLTNNPADDFDPTWSPDGSSIAFVSNRTGEYRIYIMNLESNGEPFQLTLADGIHLAPAWSNDGKKIAFSSTRPIFPNQKCTAENFKGIFSECDFEIYVIDSNGANEVRLTEREEVDGNPAWSPDDQKLSFESTFENPPRQYSIHVMNSDGTNFTRLTPSGNYDGEATWYCCRHALLFTRYSDDLFQIYELDREENNRVTRISNGEFNDGCARLSPDNSRILFLRQSASDSAQGNLYTMRVDGTDVKPLSAAVIYFDSCPDWSPR